MKLTCPIKFKTIHSKLLTIPHVLNIRTPNLPSGYASKYTNTPPASGKALEGWVVVAYFPLSKKWFDGVVVLHVPMRGPHWYAVFHEEEDFHELWEVPDPEIFFRLERAGHHVVAVQPSMLPSLTN